jgi:hypothetical protein
MEAVPVAVAEVPPAATEADIAGWLGQLRSPHAWMRDTALRELDRWGRVPAEWADKVPPPLPADDPSRLPALPRPAAPRAAPATIAPDPAHAAATAEPGHPATLKRAPSVSVAEQARVRALIGQLAGNPDPEIELAVRRAIAEAFGDHKPESLATFRGLAGDVRAGELAEDCLQQAFEFACKPSWRNRGAAFVVAVKSWKKKRQGRSLAVDTL